MPKYKLTDRQMLEILDMRTSLDINGYPYFAEDLAKEYHVSKWTIYSIWRGKRKIKGRE